MYFVSLTHKPPVPEHKEIEELTASIHPWDRDNRGLTGRDTKIFMSDTKEPYSLV